MEKLNLLQISCCSTLITFFQLFISLGKRTGLWQYTLWRFDLFFHFAKYWSYENELLKRNRLELIYKLCKQYRLQTYKNKHRDILRLQLSVHNHWP